MRSRYTAFVIKDADYLIKTWHPSCHAADFRQEIEGGFANTHWLGLTVFESSPGSHHDEGFVSFVARFTENARPGAIIERSRFLKESGQWYYIDVLRTICPDQKGLIARITNICYKHELNIVQNNEFVDHRTGRFFMRTELEGIFNDTTLLADLDSALPDGSVRELNPAGRRRIVILVTKEAHCLGDLLMKANYGGLDVEIAAVIGNHETLRTLVERFDIPFELVSHEGHTREEHDNLMAAAIEAHNPDYVVLAKYMRVLTPSFVARFPNKIINIHHSFLPAFIGARPYHQAYERGVKIIGATAHYVNDNLDEGPIIMQDVIHVDHTYTAEDMMRAGRDVEKNVLSRALYQVLAQRVFVGVSFDMMRPASSRKQASKNALPRGGVPERPKGADCKSAVIDFEGSNPSPTTISQHDLKI
ncbi:hypothetical protein ID866_2294 [Astraeus odoratus]|nr:hypothetical protein ID866_2294 [Astraeus odoratus]